MDVSKCERSVTVLSLVLVLSMAACASGKMASSSGTKTYTLSCIDFAAENINPQEAEAITSRFLIYTDQHPALEVIDRHQRYELLEEQGFQLSSPCSTVDCISIVGNILGVRFMVAGTVSKSGEYYHLEVRLIDVASSSIVNQANGDARGIEELFNNGINSVVNDLFADIGR